jgi:hypothetical protein
MLFVVACQVMQHNLPQNGNTAIVYRCCKNEADDKTKQSHLDLFRPATEAK